MGMTKEEFRDEVMRLYFKGMRDSVAINVLAWSLWDEGGGGVAPNLTKGKELFNTLWRKHTGKSEVRYRVNDLLEFEF